MMGLQFGKDSGNPYYVQVGNAIMIDPTFFDYDTKKTFRQMQLKQDQKLYDKDFIINQLVQLSQNKYSSQKKNRSHNNNLNNFHGIKRPGSQLSHNSSSRGGGLLMENSSSHSRLGRLNSNITNNKRTLSKKDLSIDS